MTSNYSNAVFNNFFRLLEVFDRKQIGLYLSYKQLTTHLVYLLTFGAQLYPTIDGTCPGRLSQTEIVWVALGNSPSLQM
jgi:hypothetical protein